MTERSQLNKPNDSAERESGWNIDWTQLFVMLLSFVAAVSIYDAYLVLRTGDMILDFEKNPIGVYLIHCDAGNPALFLRAKAAGTIVVLTSLCLMHRRARRLARTVAFALVIFQSGLLLFLESPFQ